MKDMNIKPDIESFNFEDVKNEIEETVFDLN